MKPAFDADLFEERLRSAVLEGVPEGLAAVVTHVLDAGGKRVRPKLVHLFGMLAGAPPDELLSLGLAVEFLHVATLLHDDLIDDASQRRGRDTLHRAYGPDAALLVGDLFVAACGVHAAATGHPGVSGRLFRALAMMVQGELDQRGRRYDLSQGTAEYLVMVGRKTSSLLQAAATSALLLGTEDRRLLEAADGYARHLGTAFQVRDDMLDFIGLETELGKPIGNDIHEGTVTLPLIWTIEDSPGLADLVMGVRETHDSTSVVRAVRESGALKRCQVLVAEEAEQAVRCLDVFAWGPARDGLQRLARSLVERRS